MKGSRWYHKLNIFSKSSRVTAAIATGLGSVIYPKRNYKHFAEETYMKNSIAFRAISKIAWAASSVSWEVHKRNKDGSIDDAPEHPLNMVLKKANPDESFNWVVLQAMSFLVMAGNTYLEKVAPDTGPNKGIPKELHCLRPDRMQIRINPLTGARTAFEHNVNNNITSYPIDEITGTSDVLQIKLFNPTDDWYGAAITQSVANEIDINNESMKWNYSLLTNQGKPGMVFETENLTQEQFDRLEKQLKDEYAGARNSGKSIIVEGSRKISTYGMTPSELDWLEGNRETARRIANAFGTPPMLIGIVGDSTFSNYAEARLAFWEDTVIPYLELLKGELNNWLFEDDSEYFIHYDLDNVPALESKRQILFDRANMATFLTMNEKRELVGYEKIEGGDVVLIDAGKIPLGMDLSLDDLSSTGEEETKKMLVRFGYTEEQALEFLS